MRILYLGNNSKSSTSFHRAQALRRIGNEVEIINPYVITQNLPSIISKLHYRTGYRFIQNRILKFLIANISSVDYDLVWVNSGELIGINCIRFLKSKIEKPILLYNNDDPTGGRDGRRFDTLLKAIPNYDLCVVMRDINVSEYYNIGAKKVLRVYMSYDEVNHHPLNPNEISNHFKSEVSFIGTNIPGENRDIFLLELINRNVPLSIWGARWNKSPFWKELKPYLRGTSLQGKDYVAAIQGSKICLGLLSKGNRDLHTTRTFEIPYIGSLLCAERTTEHLILLSENKEAIYWSDAEECAVKCNQFLKNEELIKKLTKEGNKRIIKDERGNENVVKQILENFQ